MKKSIIKGIFVLLFLFPYNSFAAEATTKNSPDSWGNPYMLLMIVLIFVLLLAIIVLSVGINSAAIAHDKKNKTGAGKTILTIGLILISTLCQSQEFTEIATNNSAIIVADWTIFGMTSTTFFALLGCILFEIIVIVFQLSIINGFIKKENNYSTRPEAILAPKENKFWKKVNASIALEKEEEILFDHEYDGIKELDNNLPPWWKYGFYLTILFAFAYMIHYHIAKAGPLQEEEYLTEIEDGKREVAEYLKNEADNVDENNVEYLTDENDLSEGKGIYHANCVACHGALGEGKVGPNLTDQFWIHSGRINDIFYSIKYGWPDKGMKAWKDDLTPKQIAKVSSYIKSLKGTNPLNALEPKGELFKE